MKTVEFVDVNLTNLERDILNVSTKENGFWFFNDKKSMFEEICTPCILSEWCLFIDIFNIKPYCGFQKTIWNECLLEKL